MNKIRINQGRLIMWQLRVFGTLLVFFVGALALLKLDETSAILTFIGASFLLPFLWSSYTIFEVQPAQKIILRYYWIAGMKTAKEATTYAEIEKIFINRVGMSQNAHSYTGKVHTTKSIEYKGFLKLDDGSKFLMLSHNDPERLKEKLLPIAKKLNCDLIENF